MTEELWMELAWSLGKNLVIIGIGVLLCFIAGRMGFDTYDMSPSYLAFSVILLTCQYGGILFYQGTSDNGNLGNGFQLMDPSTWHTNHWIVVIGGGVIFLILLIAALVKRHFEWLLVLAGLALIEYSVMEFFFAIFDGADGLWKLVWWALSSVYNIYVAAMSVICVFGFFIPSSNGSSSSYSAKEEKVRKEYEAKMKSLDDRERTLNAFLDNNTYTNEENYLAGNLGEQEYARRKFLRDEKEDKYRKEYEDSLSALDDDND